MEILEILKYVNLLLAVVATIMFAYTSFKHKELKIVLIMFSVNSFIMTLIYTLSVLGISLPEFTGRLNLTLILVSLNIVSFIMLEGCKK